MCTCGDNTFLESPGVGPHKSKISCGGCGKFIRWLSNKQPRMDPSLVAHVLPYCTVWEKSFVNSYKNKTYITPRQEKVWVNIVSKYT